MSTVVASGQRRGMHFCQSHRLSVNRKAARAAGAVHRS